MKWHLKYFFNNVTGGVMWNILSFLNELNDQGVAPERIKISETSVGESRCTAVYYYAEKHV